MIGNLIRHLIRFIGFIGIIIGILVIIFGPKTINNKYIEQESWIQVEGTLTRIKTYYDEDGDTTYKGFYKAEYNGRVYEFNGSSKSMKKSVEDTLTLYINPDNYDDYHREISKNEWIVAIIAGVLIIVFSFILITATKVSKRTRNTKIYRQ